MKTLREYVQEQLDRDPGYAEAQKEASAELELSEYLLDLREELGWSQRAAAERIGIRPPHLSRLEASVSLPTLHTIWKLADAYRACFTFGPDYYVGVQPAAGARHVPSTDAPSLWVGSNAYDMPSGYFGVSNVEPAPVRGGRSALPDVFGRNVAARATTNVVAKSDPVAA